MNMGVRRDNGKVEPLIVTLGTRVRVAGEFDDDKRVQELRARIQAKKNEAADLEAELERRLEDLRSGKAKPETREKPEEPAKPDKPADPVKPVPADPTKLKVRLKAKLTTLETDEAKEKGLEGGVVVGSVESGGAAEKAGLKTGDVIYEAGGEKISGTGDFRAALAKLQGGDSLECKVLRGKEKVTVKIVVDPA
ncbi:MAG: PDZ domain-containing protein [Planctomycetes bacterium]|nr:PDZ domain-containing protein [Planctomycetota bacterium]